MLGAAPAYMAGCRSAGKDVTGITHFWIVVCERSSHKKSELRAIPLGLICVLSVGTKQVRADNTKAVLCSVASRGVRLNWARFPRQAPRSWRLEWTRRIVC